MTETTASSITESRLLGAWLRAGVYVGLALAIFFVFANIFSSNPRQLADLAGKRRPLDLTGTGLLLLAAVLLLDVCSRVRRHGGSHYWRWLAFAGLLWFMGMEEQGWGREALRWRLPHPEVGEVHIDAAHDLIGIVRRLSAPLIVMLMQGTVVVIIAAFAWLLLSPAGRALRRTWIPSIAVPVILGIGFGLFGLVLDSRTAYLIWFMEKRPPYGLEEVVEFIGELLFCLAAFDRWFSERLEQRGRSFESVMPRSVRSG
jgi:hypothetical protein